jgi:hypothetical protein
MSGIERFFTTPTPAPVKKGAGRPSKVAQAEEAAAAKEAAAAEEAVLAVQLEAVAIAAAQERDWAAEAMEHDRRHRKRPAGNTNWALPENQAVLAPAVKGWLDGTAKKEGRSMVAWCLQHSTEEVLLKKGTFSMYVTANESKRLKLVEDGGREVGKPASLDKQDAQLLTDVIRRSDRGNEPKSLPQIVDIIQELNPALDRKAARHAFTTVQSKRPDELTGKVKAHATTTARSAITVPQQFRWHTLIDDTYAESVRLNTCCGVSSLEELVIKVNILINQLNDPNVRVSLQV